jgi:hypothetical protein
MKISNKNSMNGGLQKGLMEAKVKTGGGKIPETGRRAAVS